MSPRRRALVVSAALLAVALVAVGVVVVLADDADTPTVDAGAGTKEVSSVGDLERVDAFVLLAPPADATELARLRSALDEADVVERYLALPYGWATVMELRLGGGELFGGGLPAGLVDACPGSMRPGVLVVTAAASDRAAAELDEVVAPAVLVTDEFGASAGFLPLGAFGGQGDAEVFMDVDATAEQIAALDAELAADADIASVEHLTKADSFEVFQGIFADQPELVANVDPESLPESFRVDLHEGVDADAFVARYRGRLGVDDVLAAWRGAADLDVTQQPRVAEPEPDDGVNLEIVMDVDATPEQVAAIGDALSAAESVDSYDHVTREAALDEFRRVFQDQPDLIVDVDPASLPESYRVVAPPEELDELESDFSGRAGVDEVVVSRQETGSFELVCPPALRDP